jgi:hypothetical protein
MSENPSKKAALLVDWENLRGAMSSRGYREDVKSVSRKLVTWGNKLAADRSATLNYHTAFLAPTSLNTPMAQQLQDGGLDVELSTVAKNAADTKLVIAAVKLLLKDRFRLFFIVSGDIDYIDLLQGLNVEGAESLLLPLDSHRLSGEVKRHAQSHGLYVAEQINLEKPPPPEPDEVALFTVLAQNEILESGKLVFNKVRDDFARYFIGAKTPVDSLWDAAKKQKYFIDREEIKGRTGYVKRPNYENEKVIALLNQTDIVLGHIIAFQRRGGCSLQMVFNLLDDATLLPDPTDQHRHVELMKDAGLIAVMGDEAKVVKDGVEDGLLRPFLRLVLIAWGQALFRGWEALPTGMIANRWPYQIQGHNAQTNPQVASPIVTRARNLVVISEKVGILNKTAAADGRPVYSVRWENPLAHATREAVKEIILFLKDASEANGYSYVQFDEFMGAFAERGARSPLLLPADNLEYFWLNALAAERHVKFSYDAAKGRRIRLVRSSRLVQEITGLRPDEEEEAAA